MTDELGFKKVGKNYYATKGGKYLVKPVGWEGNSAGHSEARLNGMYSGAKKHNKLRMIEIKPSGMLPQEAMNKRIAMRFPEKEKIPTKKNYVRTDAWRGYYTFPNSVYDTWATGEWSDAGENAGSKVKERIARVRKALRKEGIASKVKATQASNAFSTGVDVLVAPSNVERAKKIVESGGFE